MKEDSCYDQMLCKSTDCERNIACTPPERNACRVPEEYIPAKHDSPTGRRNIYMKAKEKKLRAQWDPEMGSLSHAAFSTYSRHCLVQAPIHSQQM